MSEFSVVHKSLPRVDGYEKVTGRAKYGGDLFFPGMLYGKVLRAKYPHARILSINTEKAKALPGVAGVFTAADVPGSKVFGVIVKDQPVLAVDKVRFMGDGVAMVAAETPEIAEAALKLIEVEYEELPAVFDPREAVKPGAPVIHESAPDNKVIHYPLRKGDVEKGFAESDVILEREYTTQMVEHAYIEPEAVVAVPNPLEDSIVVHGSIQNPFSTRRAVAAVLNLPLARTRIIQSVMGGAFGGKDEVMSAMACRAAVMAMKTGRPVKMVNTREESIIESYKRHPFYLKYKVGATRDGKIKAMEIWIMADSGAYACQSPFVTWRAVVQATGPYQIENVKTDVYAAYTNNTYTGAMRGYGSPQIIFAQESLMDELAEELNMDPLTLRKINGLTQGAVTATGQKLDSHVVSLHEVMDKATAAADFTSKWRQYREPQRGTKKRGIGMAVSLRGCSLGAEGVDAAGAIVNIQADGSVILLSGIVENGQGLRTAFSQIVADVLGIPLQQVTFIETDTSLIPDSGPSVASRGTLMGGKAAYDAAAKVRDILLGLVAEKWDVAPADLVSREGLIYLKSDPGRSMSFQEAVKLANSEGVMLASFGWAKAPKVSWDEPTGQGNAYFTYVYGCQVAEVEVDTETGKVDVLKVAAAHDVGRAINPALVRGQINGGVAMAVGYATMEEVELENGVTKNTNLDEYIIPTSMDMPEVTAIAVENPDPFGGFGGKSLGEPTTELLAPAIVNAIYNATGKRIRNLPADLERVLLGKQLRAKRQKRGSGQ